MQDANSWWSTCHGQNRLASDAAELQISADPRLQGLGLVVFWWGAPQCHCSVKVDKQRDDVVLWCIMLCRMSSHSLNLSFQNSVEDSYGRQQDSHIVQQPLTSFDVCCGAFPRLWLVPKVAAVACEKVYFPIQLQRCRGGTDLAVRFYVRRGKWLISSWGLSKNGIRFLFLTH